MRLDKAAILIKKAALEFDKISNAVLEEHDLTVSQYKESLPATGFNISSQKRINLYKTAWIQGLRESRLIYILL